MKFSVFLSVAILLFSSNVHPQSSRANPCSRNMVVDPSVMRTFSATAEQQRATSDYDYVFRIYVHILRNTNGTNAAVSLQELDMILLQMADYFKPHNICFISAGLDFIDNTTWNINYNTNMIGAMHAVNPHDDAIDIYIHKNFLIDDGDTIGGTAYSIPSTRFSVDINAGFNFWHEMGHCLGLLHTFANAYSECPNGQECSNTGDFVCDTNADYPGSQNDVTNCVYTGDEEIFCPIFAGGGIWPYDPPVENHMSYNRWCTTLFTPGQGTRMHLITDVTGYMGECLVPFNAALTDTIIFGQHYTHARELLFCGSIFGSGNVFILGNANSLLNAGRTVTIAPGTTIAPTTGRFHARINDLCE